jgi:hypothetical protein
VLISSSIEGRDDAVEPDRKCEMEGYRAGVLGLFDGPVPEREENDLA